MSNCNFFLVKYAVYIFHLGLLIDISRFIIRALVNTSNFFRPYAKFWYNPLVDFLVNSSLASNESIDYFTLDLVVLLLSWHNVCLPNETDKSLVNKLFLNMIKRCYHENRAILKNNLELLRAMTECWRNLISVPVEVLNTYLKSSDQKMLTTGIQIYGVILSNQIQEYDFPQNLKKVDFYKNLLKCMKEPSKTLHASSAEVIGMLLSIMYKNDIDNEIDEIIDYLQYILTGLKIELLITCLHRISLNYPNIGASFMAKMLFNLPQLYGEFKIMCAETLLASIKHLQDPLFKTNTFMDMIQHRDSSLQLICLKMIEATFVVQTKEEQYRLLKIVCNFINHPNVACRYQMTLILKSVDDNFSNEIKKLVGDVLLKLLYLLILFYFTIFENVFLLF